MAQAGNFSDQPAASHAFGEQFIAPGVGDHQAVVHERFLDWIVEVNRRGIHRIDAMGQGVDAFLDGMERREREFGLFGERAGLEQRRRDRMLLEPGLLEDIIQMGPVVRVNEHVALDEDGSIAGLLHPFPVAQRPMVNRPVGSAILGHRALGPIVGFNEYGFGWSVTGGQSDALAGGHDDGHSIFGGSAVKLADHGAGG